MLITQFKFGEWEVEEDLPGRHQALANNIQGLIFIIIV